MYKSAHKSSKFIGSERYRLFLLMNNDYDADWYCPYCGNGNYYDVGFSLQDVCDNCHAVLPQPKSQILNSSDDDVLLDERYVTFDSVKAFRKLRDLNMLDDCV